MFGYVQIRKPELKIKDYETYHGFYCGLCKILKEQYGFLGQITLTYDMTYLIILLSSVYDVTTESSKERCLVHPTKKHLRLYNEVSEYAAHVNLLLAYYKFKDDREDEHSKKAWMALRLYKKKKGKAALKYEKLEAEMACRLQELSNAENDGNSDLSHMAECFGRIMESIFSYREDCFAKELRSLGYHLGKFIYIMDAYDDLEEDEQDGKFNPLFSWKKLPDFEERVENLLLDAASMAGVSYQKLPCVAYADILGNILYAGIWNRYDAIQQKKQEKSKEELK